MPSCIRPTGLKPLKNVGFNTFLLQSSFQKEERSELCIRSYFNFQVFLVHSNLYWSAERSVHRSFRSMLGLQ